MISRRFIQLFRLFFLILAPIACASDSGLSVTAQPDVPLIEHRDGQQLLNFDLAVSNHDKSTLRLSEIQVSVFDFDGRLVSRRTVNSDGLAPGVEIVAKALLAPGDTVDIFNPFYSFPDGTPIHRMEYVLHYLLEDNDAEREQNRHRLPMDYDVETRISVSPRDNPPKTNLILPLAGRVFVWEGHDFYAHHRRVPLHAGSAQKLGLRANPNRYASDLVIVDEKGQMYRGDPYNKKNWYTYGVPIYAPADGKVVASANDIPDNEFQGKHIVSPDLGPTGADPELGNFVLLDHGNSEFSLLPHMMPGSVRVKAGQTVHQGEIIGRVGFSGDAIFPHVHYALLSGPDIPRSEGLPAYFTHFRRLLGGQSLQTERGTLDTGDFVESTTADGR